MLGSDIKAFVSRTTLAHLKSFTGNATSNLVRKFLRATPLSNIMVVWTALVLAAAVLMAEAAVPDLKTSGITTVGSLKLATAADCAGVVAFSATRGSIKDTKMLLAETLVDKGVGYAAETGIFTIHCPGLYQFSFAGYGDSDLRLTLKRKLNKSEDWTSVASVGPGGGANLVLLDVDVGDQLSVFVEKGEIADGATFSGYRVAKK